MSEFITVQVGQCGNQIGSAFWPLVLEEYGITKYAQNEPAILDRSFHSFFNCPKGVPKTSNTVADLKKLKITARALLIDMEDKVIDRFQHGGLKHLFDKKCFLRNHPGSGNNWATGHYTHYETHQSTIEDMLRWTAEKCDSLHGVIVLLSLGGGTGSGLGTAIVRLLEDQFPLIDRLVACVHPGEYNDVITSPYNIAHSLRILTDHASIVVPVDNKALEDICIKHKLNRGVKPFEDANSVIVNMLLNLTSGSRFSGSLNCDVSDLNTLVPRPGLHYLSASLSPINLNPPQDVGFVNKKRDLLHEICSKDNQLLRINSFGGHMLSAALLCRGNTSLYPLREYVSRFRSKVKFASWSDPGVKTGLCSSPPMNHPSSMLCLANSTNMGNFFKSSLKHFNRLYRRKAHVHHYTKVDGCEQEDFELTKESLSSIVETYSEAANCTDIPRIQIS